MLEARVLHKVLSTSPEHLSGLSKRLGIPEDVTICLRRLWTRRIEGKCVACGKLADGELCDACSKSALPNLDSRTVSELIQELPDAWVLLRGSCVRCRKDITRSVQDIRLSLEKGRRFPVHVCRECRQKRREAPLTHRPFQQTAAPNAG